MVRPGLGVKPRSGALTCRRRKDDRPMATFTKVCFYCKQEFEATHSLANICSLDCRNATHTSRSHKARSRPLESEARLDRSEVKLPEVDQETCGINVRCLRCGKAIQDATGTRKYCSATCRRAGQRQSRKAMLRRAFVEPVSMAVLRRRDEDRCRLCGKPVDFTTQPPHPSAATIDHVIALARGGEHSYGNTQFAHHRCNTAKGAS